MADFDGPDLLVGEILAVRTFDLRSDGSLWPVFAADKAWADGDNEAHCSLHEAAGAPGCFCGFWAYGSVAALRDQTNSHNVAAVISCWGRVTPGTRGLRTRYARIEAIWLSRRVSAALVDAVVRRYPQAVIYRDRGRMLAEHPLTVMPSYIPDRRWRPTRVKVTRKILQLIMVVAVLLGALPASVYRAHTVLQDGVGEARLLLTYAALGSVVQFIAFYRANRARAWLILRRMLPAVLGLLMWVWAAATPLAVDILLRIPIALWLGRNLMNRTIRFLPTRATAGD